MASENKPWAWSDVVGILGTTAIILGFLAWLAWLVFG